MAKQLLVFIWISSALVGFTSYATGNPASTDYVDKRVLILESQIAKIPVGPQGPAGPQGTTGPAGANGANGQGTPAGGTADQVLAKIDGANYNTEWVTLPSPAYEIGQHTEGGIVFFVYTDSGDVEHALIAAPADEPGGTIYTWGLAATPGTAQHRCANKNDGTYSDWFLPNKAQIYTLFVNRYALAPVIGVPLPGDPLTNNGGFTLNAYWSSTEFDLTFAWPQRFGIGSQNGFLKTSLFAVRCIRAV